MLPGSTDPALIKVKKLYGYDYTLGRLPGHRDIRYRVHTGNIHDVKGFGLGLSYIKTMITAHHGSVDVKSELGKGSSFILYFPFNQPSIG